MSVSEVAASGWRLKGSLYQEPRLDAAGIPHGVTTRALGNMKDAFLRSAALDAAGLRGRSPLILAQEHGTVVVEAKAAPMDSVPRADGWICADRGAAPAVFVADCVPLFLWDLDRSVVGVFHAGWRGLAAGMPRAAVRAFRRYGVTPEKIRASAGPHIGPCCYRVGPEVAERFRSEARAVSPEGTRLDLGEEARLQFVESGIAPDRISIARECTACRGDRLFSFRRDKTDVRMLAFIALP